MTNLIEDLLDHIGVEDIRPLGQEVQARCPQHEQRTGEREHRPDHWSINRMSGAHHCFSCEYSGSLTRLIMDMTGMGLWEAHQMLRQFDVELGGIEEAPWEPPVTATVERRLDDFDVPPPRALKRRHITVESALRYRLKWDHDESAWVIPIISPTGETWGWQCKFPDRIRNYPPGIKKGRTLFGLDVLRASHVVLVESPLDCAYLDSIDVPAVAAFGCQISDRQMKLLIERCDQVILALDNDKAGIAETRRLLEEKWHHRLPILVFDYAGLKGKDPGELTRHQVANGIEDAVLASFW
jgi:DNA primase